MEPVIRNVRSAHTPGSPFARMISVDDNPPTCTMHFSEILPGETSSHHIHPWEHELYVLQGSGTLYCDDKGYPVKEGDAIFVPPQVEHYTLNDGGQGNIQRIEVNPLIASQSGGAAGPGGAGTGEPPVIRNYRDLTTGTGSRILGSNDGAPNYVMLYNGAMAPGAVSHADTGGHIHPWEHVVYILEGSASIVCEGKEYGVTQGDAVLVPPNVFHQWRNTSGAPMKRVTFNPLAAEGSGG